MRSQVSLILVLVVISVNFHTILCQPPGCSCEDEKPPGAQECSQLVKFGECGTSTTLGETYCRCSCGFCPSVQGGIPTQAPIVTLPPTSADLLATLYPTTTSAAAVAFEGIQRESLSSSVGFSSYAAATPTIGFTVGGAKGIDNFRNNIDNDFLPSPYDVTYEGIFNDYFFDTRDESSGQCEQLFCPSFSAALSPDPLYEESANELYLAVGLDSGLAAASFERKPLNLVILLDISGSMKSEFDQYAYDGPVNDNELWGESKLSVAKTALQDMLQHLRDGDQLSIVTFDSLSDVVQKLQPVQDIDMTSLKGTISEIYSGGSTNLEAGFTTATKQLTDCFVCVNLGLEQFENRIIILTDAQANTGDYSDTGLATLITQNSQQGIFTSIVGIGLDFNSELIESITKTRGANYFNVYSPSQFRQKLNKEFDFIVTPLVFDLKLEIDAMSFDNGNGWQVIKVYGSPNIDGGLTKEGTLIDINTLFPSPKTEEGIKGGVVLLKLFKPRKNIPLKLKVTYIERDTLATKESSSQVDQFDGQQSEFYGSSGVQKAIVLSRYIDLLRGWLIDQYTEPIKTSYPCSTTDLMLVLVVPSWWHAS
eukprot:TRINITY_DN351_c1_g1_i5.p1 TRINITY_DN351_c1_g1~~TRINITY_DN351_c1_g1_i5.p1  ORF type:complete len:593 (+),score=81.22 TRINITY_DN351_c1_g1_i5:83-1861(+)